MDLYFKEIINYLGPYSELYGSSNALLDLCFILGFLFLLTLYYAVKSSGTYRTDYIDLPQARAKVSRRDKRDFLEIDGRIDRLIKQTTQLGTIDQQDLTYVFQELGDSRRTINELSESLVNSARRTRKKSRVFKKSFGHDRTYYKKSA